MELVDLNLAIALLHRRHPHFARADAWLRTKRSPGSLILCRVVQMGALRLTTQTTIMKEDVLKPSEFWEAWDRLLEDDRFVLVENEPPGLEARWRAICADLPKGRIAETDTYLAAFALAGGHTLATFDRGFARYDGLATEILA